MELDENGAGIDLIHKSPLQRELYFLIAKFLAEGPCQGASEALIQELERNEIIPKSVNWLGEPVPQDYKTFSSKFDHIRANHLPNLLGELAKIINGRELSASPVASRSLLSLSALSFIQRGGNNGGSSQKCSDLSWCKKTSYQNALVRTLRPDKHSLLHPVQAICNRLLTGGGVGNSIIPPEFYKRIGISCNTLGHLSAVYCVLFDISGRYVFTGADDHLIKIWSAINGRLICTFRGTASEIVDLDINQENTLLAVASCEKNIHVWCIKTGAPIATLSGQNGNTTSIFFCPMPRSRSSIRYLASTATDGSCAFWSYTDEPGEPVIFHPKPTLYLERMRPGNAKMNCSSFSSGGLFMAAGSADNHVRVYHMLAHDGPERILEVEHHSDRVESISWAHEGLRFVSGSTDGTALIWRFENACWRYIRLYCYKTIGETPVIQEPKRRAKVTMVAWNRDDTLVLTAVADFMIRVWNSKTGELVRVLKDHSHEIYVIEPHPINPRIVCTAGHDGKLIMWDIGTTNKTDKSEKIFEYYNQLGEGQGYGALFDCKWSPDGFSMAATDSHGHFMLFTIEGDNGLRFKKLPKELFFHTDYRPITRDAITNEILDEQTQTLPHLMPPPFLVDVDGNPYPPDLQRLVPGRENMQESYLVPNVAVSDRGIQEVIEGIPSVPVPVQVPVVLAPLPGTARSNIDERIQELAREQGLERANENNRNERRGVGHRRSGEVEGVRQSREIWSSGPQGNSRNCVIPPIPISVQQASENIRMELLEAEEKWYHEHLIKYSPVSSTSIGVPAAVGSPAETVEGRSRRIRRLAAQAAERRLEHNEEQAGFSQLEGVARPNPRPQQEISISQGGSRRPPMRQRRTGIATLNNNNGNTNRRPRQIRYDVRRILRNQGDSDVENLDLDDSSSEANIDLTTSGSSSSSDSDSDWGGNLRRTPQTQGHRLVGRTRTTRNNSHSSQSEQENEEPEQNRAEPRAGPSSEITGAIKTEPTKASRPRKARVKVDYSGEGLEDIEEPYRPPDWLTEQYPKRSPYFPQLGDELVYYRQGHEIYIKYVEDNNLYQITKKMKKSLPYVLKPELEAEVSVRVVGVKFELEPPRVVVLKLARTEWETGELIKNDYLYVKYHDVANVVDFLILRQMYDKSIRRRWNEGDRFRCLIWPHWWIGTIEKNEPKDPLYPSSHYLCYQVKWDNGDPEWMSPWDMDTIPDDFIIPPDGHDGISASDEDLRIGLYEPGPNDWPPHGHQDAQCQKLSNLLEQVMALAISEAFLTPVDLKLYPDYVTQIEYPVDFSTIKSRIDNRFYRRVDALKFDIKYIAMNTEKYNKQGSDIVKHAQVVRDVCLEMIANPNITTINPIYQKLMKNVNTEASTSKKTSGKSSGSKGANNKSSQSSSSKMRLRGRHDEEDSEDEDAQRWEEQCLELLNEIYHKKDAVPFRDPVDIIEYPEYYQVIDTPMALGAIREDLLGGNYHTVQDFHKDMLLIFSNSKQYNQEKSAIYAMTCRLQSLYECQIKPILRQHSHNRSYRSIKKKHKQKKKTNLTPSKGSRGHRGTSSLASTPRKNPRRSAAGKNPYVNQSESSEEEHSPVRELRTRQNNAKRRSSLSQVNGNSAPNTPQQRRMNGHSSATGTSTPSRNGTTSSRNSTESSGASRPRRVKRFRISSGESPQNSPRRVKIKVEAPSSRSGLRNKLKIPAKEEHDSDEFEDSDDGGVDMPTLNKVNDDNYDSEEDSEAEYNVRRSGRKKRRVDESDEHGYETRNRGKPSRNYVEPQEPSEDDEGRFGKRRRIISSTSPTRNTRSHSHPFEPPVLKRSARISSEEESEHEDTNRPGTSSRLMRVRGAADKSKSPTIKNALEEDEEEDDSENESESEEENDDEENSDLSEDEGKKKRGQQRPRRPLRVRQNGSDDDDYEVAGSKKLKNVRSSRRPTRGANASVDYAEDSDSERETRITETVSSRGRVRRTKSYIQD